MKYSKNYDPMDDHHPIWMTRVILDEYSLMSTSTHPGWHPTQWLETSGSDLMRSSGSDPLVYFPIVHNEYPRFDDQIICNKMIWSSNFDIGLTLGKFRKLLIWCRRTFYCINWSNDSILSKCWNQTFDFLKLNLNQMI